MDQKTLVAIGTLALMAAIALATPQVFAQVSNGGVTEDDDTANISERTYQSEKCSKL